jgi:spore germination protein KA
MHNIDELFQYTNEIMQKYAVKLIHVGDVNILFSLNIIKKLIIFNEPDNEKKFIIKESPVEKSNVSQANKDKNQDKKDSSSNNDKKKGQVKKLVKEPKIKLTIEKDLTEDKNNQNLSREEQSSSKEKKESNQVKDKTKISKELKDNLEYMKKVYSIPVNSDIVIREFEITVKESTVNAFAIFYDGMTDRAVINHAILGPLMLLSSLPIKGNEKDIGEYIIKHLLPQTQIKATSEYNKVIEEVNFGGCGVFIDGIGLAITADTKGWEHRTVERPNTELVIRGPQEGFTELLRVNTALIRKILKDSDLIAESIKIGVRSQTPCAIMYIKDIVNDSLVDEVRRRLKSIKVDYIIDSGELEQYIEDSSLFPMPQVIATERPDRMASLLAEGRVGIIVHGSPFVLVVPATFSSLLHSPEDTYSRFPYGNVHRLIRILAVIFSLLLPGLYIAITNYHQEMIPTDLLLAIATSREKVPFPSVVEILIMEISFELIREAGVRIPGPIGPTLGIIGALILGQAAVAANIVSPILIIVIAVTGIGSFGIPNFSTAFSFRIMRFYYIILGSLAGFLGITIGLFMHIIWLASFNTFGVPFMAPFAPTTMKTSPETIIRGRIWKQERRPDFLNPKDVTRQSKRSRGWTKDNANGERKS